MKALVIVVLLAVPGSLAAQTLPGSPALDDTRLAPAIWTTSVALRRGDQEIQAGTVRHELVELPAGRWGYITTTTSQLGTATDTSIAQRGTLAPISHRSHAVPRMLSLDYDGRTVTGTYAPREGEPRAIATETEVAAFDAAMLDIVIGALPLAPGYATRLPLYIEEKGGLTWAEIVVDGERSVGGVPGWSVRIEMPPRTVRLVLARDDHRFLGGSVEHPNGATIVMARQ